MSLRSYIEEYYPRNKETWFKEEVNKSQNFKRINNMINIKEYLTGQHKIKSRVNESYNGRSFETRKIVLQYVKPILSFETSFLLSKPVTLCCDNEKTLNVYKTIYNEGRYNNTDFEIIDKLVKYGEVYEYLYLDDKGIIRSKLINSEDSYPVYDDFNNMVAFIEHFTINAISYYIVYTDEKVYEYDNKGSELNLRNVYNNLSGLPIVYKTDNEINPNYGRSDIEDYIDILDNMEDLLSKYMDSFYKYLNPIPVVKGTKLNIGGKGEGAINPSVVGYALQLDNDSDFSFVNSTMDYKSFDILYKTLKQALLDISMTPSVGLNNGEISNVSEVSIKMLYSMACIKANMNRRYMIRGFIDRWDKIKRVLGYVGISLEGNVDCIFDINIPQNEKEVIDNLKELNDMGVISLDSLLERCPYIYDVISEKRKLKREENEKNKANNKVNNSNLVNNEDKQTLVKDSDKNRTEVVENDSDKGSKKGTRRGRRKREQK